MSTFPGQLQAPKNIFTETDLYTITAADGSRVLTLEHGLSQLETDFCIIREKVLAGTISTADEHTSLCVFTAATQARTKAQRNQATPASSGSTSRRSFYG